MYIFEFCFRYNEFKFLKDGCLCIFLDNFYNIKVWELLIRWGRKWVFDIKSLFLV